MSYQSPRPFWSNLWRNLRFLLTHDLNDVVNGLSNIAFESKQLKHTSIKNISELAATNYQLVATNQHLEQELALLKSVVQSLNTRVAGLNGLDISIKHIFPVNTPRAAFNTTAPYMGEINSPQFDKLLALNTPRCSWDSGTSSFNQQINETPFSISCWSTPKHSKEICEDALLIDLHKSELFCTIADGVSHSVCSYLAAAYVCKYLHFEWKTALQNDEFSTFSLRDKTEKLVREALYQAKYHAHEAVVNEITTINDEIVRSTLTQVHANVGTQATFACAFTIQSHIVCVWMGNTRITCYDHMSKPLIDVSDHRFDDDNYRFSSRTNPNDSSIGIRGQINIEIIDTRNIPAWNMLIFSDALENHKQQLVADTISVSTLGNQILPDYASIINDAATLDDATLVHIAFQSSSDDYS